GQAYEQILLQNLRGKYAERPIGVIVAIGSETLNVVLRWRSTVWPDTPVVFAMVDKPTIDQLNLPANVTGTILSLSLGDEIIAARAVVTDLKRVALVGDVWKSKTAYRH